MTKTTVQYSLTVNKHYSNLSRITYKKRKKINKRKRKRKKQETNNWIESNERMSNTESERQNLINLSILFSVRDTIYTLIHFTANSIILSIRFVLRDFFFCCFSVFRSLCGGFGSRFSLF